MWIPSYELKRKCAYYSTPDVADLFRMGYIASVNEPLKFHDWLAIYTVKYLLLKFDWPFWLASQLALQEMWANDAKCKSTKFYIFRWFLRYCHVSVAPLMDGISWNLAAGTTGSIVCATFGYVSTPEGIGHNVIIGHGLKFDRRVTSRRFDKSEIPEQISISIVCRCCTPIVFRIWWMASGEFWNSEIW